MSAQVDCRVESREWVHYMPIMITFVHCPLGKSLQHPWLPRVEIASKVPDLPELAQMDSVAGVTLVHTQYQRLRDIFSIESTATQRGFPGVR